MRAATARCILGSPLRPRPLLLLLVVVVVVLGLGHDPCLDLLFVFVAVFVGVVVLHLCCDADVLTLASPSVQLLPGRASWQADCACVDVLVFIMLCVPACLLSSYLVVVLAVVAVQYLVVIVVQYV